jgi:large subunit ribosomal protein L18
MSKHVSKSTNLRTKMRVRRHLRVRNKVNGTPDKPRLAIFRSSRHIYAQVIDDTKGATLVSVSTLTADLKKKFAKGDKKEKAKVVGEEIAKRCKKKKISQVVFDRGGFLFTGGRIKAVAEGAREGGLKF